MRTAIVSYLLKYFVSFSATELNNIESEDEVSAQEFSYEESNYGDSNDSNDSNCIASRLNNNYFPLSESSSLY